MGACHGGMVRNRALIGDTLMRSSRPDNGIGFGSWGVVVLILVAVMLALSNIDPRIGAIFGR